MVAGLAGATTCLLFFSEGFPMHAARTRLMLFALVSSCAVAPAQPQQRPLVTGVSKIDRPVSCNFYEGVVDKIDADEIVVVQPLDRDVSMVRRLTPIDLLRDGKYIREKYDSANSYLWADVKKGDTVQVRALRDDGDGKMYCLQISICRRPGGKLPESQEPKKDSFYNARRVLNEIENGNDVSDEELLKTWPTRGEPGTDEYKPGGLAARFAPYREKLEANRKRIAEEKEKKEKELKAKPVEKK